MLHPPRLTYEIGSTVTVRWEHRDSSLDRFIAIELFDFGGLVELLWVGNVSVQKGSVNIVLQAPGNVPIPGTYFLRAWGASNRGPQCVTYKQNFQCRRRNRSLYSRCTKRNYVLQLFNCELSQERGHSLNTRFQRKCHNCEFAKA